MLFDGTWPVTLDYETFPRTGLARPWVVAVASTAVAAAMSRSVVLFGYVLRIATVARRTAADFGPVLPQQDIEWRRSPAAGRAGRRSR